MSKFRELDQLGAVVQELRDIVTRFEAVVPHQYPPMATSHVIDWRRYPALLDAQHLAEIYSRPIDSIRKGLQQRSHKLPTPCQSRPFKVRKDDCKRHFDRMAV